jgi:Flp pilus assembly protein TadD
MAAMQNAVVGSALTAQDRAASADSDRAITYRDQAIRLSLQGRFADSEAVSRQALRLRPDDIDVLNELGVAIWRQGRAAEAQAVYLRACRIKPNDFRILTNLGLALNEQGRPEEAAESFRAALRVQPDFFDALMNLGIALSDLGKFDEAMDCLRRSLQLRPDSADAFQNVGMNLVRQGSWEEAIGYYEQALRLRPEFPAAHLNLAYALLCCGDFERGWPEHEWRLKCGPYQSHRINRTFWNGDDFHGRTILLHAEQGFGDTLQFIRFAELVKRRGGRVVVLCQAPLLRLIARCAGVDLAFDGSSYEPECHVHAPLMSLPAILGTTWETLPARVPYLALDPLVVEHWRSVLTGTLHDAGGRDSAVANQSGGDIAARPLLIGVAWQGNPTQQVDRWRSFPLAKLATLAGMPGVRLVSLQVGPGLDQIPALPGRFPIITLPSRRPRDFLDTAAIMTQLDLVITPDSAVAHLAGALGTPVWVGLGSVHCHRWMAKREDSPWYPTMRLFRQSTLGDWDGVFRRMADALKRELEGIAASR